MAHGEDRPSVVGPGVAQAVAGQRRVRFPFVKGEENRQTGNKGLRVVYIDMVLKCVYGMNDVYETRERYICPRMGW